jgi:hypothetical protein
MQCNIIMFNIPLAKMVLVLIFFSGALYATQEEESPLVEQDEAAFFAIVNETGGYLTQTVHDAFWEILKKKYDEKQREKIVVEIHDALDLLREFQAQTWLSAKESYFSQKVTKVKEYGILKTRLLKLKPTYFSPKAMVLHAEEIIKAAATRSPLDFGSGKCYITPELIEENRIGIQGSYERLSLLLTPEWKETLKEYILPNITVSLLALYAPDEYHETLFQDDEKIDIHLAQLSVGKDAMYEIGSVDYQKGDKKFLDFTLPEREVYIQEFVKEQFSGYSLTAPLLSKGVWRGYEFVKGVASLSEGHIIIMSLFVNNKAFYIKYVTDAPLALANADFNEFTKRIQIIEDFA